MNETMPWHLKPEMKGMKDLYTEEHAWQEAHYLHATYCAMLNILERRYEIKNNIDMYQKSYAKFDMIEEQLMLEDIDYIELNLATNHAALRIKAFGIEAEQLDNDRQSLDVFAEVRLQQALVDWENDRIDNGFVIYQEDRQMLLPLPGETIWKVISQATLDLRPSSSDNPQ
jgi:hypothetical protein